MIWDDQALVVNVRDRGLVVISGCSHAGAINVLRHAQRLTGESRVAGFIGGLHLTGGLFESRIEPTVEALRAAGVGRVVPAHCSGWKAVHAIARAMPEAFVQAAVGTTRHVLTHRSPGPLVDSRRVVAPAVPLKRRFSSIPTAQTSSPAMMTPSPQRQVPADRDDPDSSERRAGNGDRL